MATRRQGADLTMALLAVAAPGAIGLAAFIELAVAMPVPRWLYMTAGAFALASAVVPMALDPARKRVVVTSAGCLLLLLALAVLHLVPWSSRKPFLQSLDRVQIGMSEAEVRQVMAGYRTGTGWPAGPSGDGAPPENLVEVSTGTSHPVEASPNGELAIRGSIVFRHSNDGRFNSDWGVVTFRNGKVVSVQFMPD